MRPAGGFLLIQLSNARKPMNHKFRIITVFTVYALLLLLRFFHPYFPDSLKNN